MSRVWGTELRPRHVVTETKCDGCVRVERGEPEGWYDFATSHSDWGSDSPESHVQLDACSVECYLKILRQVLDEYGDYPTPTLVVDGKDYAFARALVERAEGASI